MKKKKQVLGPKVDEEWTKTVERGANRDVSVCAGLLVQENPARFKSLRFFFNFPFLLASLPFPITVHEI